jgi:hypothetical protein
MKIKKITIGGITFLEVDTTPDDIVVNLPGKVPTYVVERIKERIHNDIENMVKNYNGRVLYSQRSIAIELSNSDADEVAEKIKNYFELMINQMKNVSISEV